MSGRRVKRSMAGPTALDRVISWIDPVRGAERARARMVLALAGGYTGARHSRRATIGWMTDAASADSDIMGDLPTLRARVRDLVRNAPIAAGALATVTTNVVGSGLKLKAAVDREALGLSDAAAEAWERRAEREFALWAAQACITGGQSFAEMQGLAFRSALESGDVLVLRRFRERLGAPYGLRLQLVEADRVATQGADRPGLVGGVESDADGYVQAYHISSRHPGDWGAGVKQEWVRLPARDAAGELLALHLFDRLRPGQTRGVPYMAAVIEPLKQLDRYSEAELMAAAISAMFTVFIKSEDGDGAVPPIAATETGAKASDDDLKLGTGAIVGLAPGEDVTIANPGRPNANFDPFFEAIVRQIGVALELPFEVLIKHFSASYSASRAALEMAWQFYRARRAWLARRLCQPVYGWVIAEAVARGRLAAPGFFADAATRAAWLGAEWVGPARITIDPVKDITADQTMVGMGVKTLAEVTAERTGGDWEAKQMQRQREERLRAAGGTAAGAARPAAADRPDDDPDSEDLAEWREVER